VANIYNFQSRLWPWPIGHRGAVVEEPQSKRHVTESSMIPPLFSTRSQGRSAGSGALVFMDNITPLLVAAILAAAE
jgi:hypothetical protein